MEGPMRRVARWIGLSVIGLTAMSACGDAFGVRDVLGIWTTTSIGGYTVPGTVVYEGGDFDTQYVRWAFYDGGQCTLTQLVDGFTSTYDDCDYTVDVEQGTVAISFLSEIWDGVLDGDNMTLTDPLAVAWTLRRQ